MDQEFGYKDFVRNATADARVKELFGFKNASRGLLANAEMIEGCSCLAVANVPEYVSGFDHQLFRIETAIHYAELRGIPVLQERDNGLLGDGVPYYGSVEELIGMDTPTQPVASQLKLSQKVSRKGRNSKVNEGIHVLNGFLRESL